MKVKHRVLTVALLFLVVSVSAQFSEKRIEAFLGGIKDRVNEYILSLFCLIWYLIAALAALLILWSGIKYLTSEDFEGRNKAKNRLIQVIVGLIVVLIACPLINFLVKGTQVEEFSCVCLP